MKTSASLGRRTVLARCLLALGTVVGAFAADLSAGIESADAPDWRLAMVPSNPPASLWHAMAYDSARGRVVLLLRPYPSVGFADTWEWNGSSWIQRTPATSPPIRNSHAMAYDSARGRVVLFGGNSDGFLRDTWEWDGNTWVERTQLVSPHSRDHHAMAYDSARGRVVLFGGRGSFGDLGNLGDTWEWDGTAWVEHTPATSPPPRYAHAMAYDGARSRVVLFGGLGNGGYLGDTWEWDGSTWVERTPPAGSPEVREFHRMAYDGAHGRVVLFGGYGDGGYLGDTWEWDGAAWVERTPGASPPARDSHAMAYDGARGRAVLFGGYDGSNDSLADTWEWDGNTWVERPAASPPARDSHAMAYDSARGRAVLFGGWYESSSQGDTWEWDGNTWIERPVAGPPARNRHAMAYDSARGRTVLFGGESWTYGTFADTWEWDGTSWVRRTPATSPPTRTGHAMAYDSARGRVVLFGGYNYSGGYLADTWEWNGATWAQRTPATRPSGRYFHAMAYDSARGRVVLFGGSVSGSGYSADTWEWDGNSWIQRTPAASPPARGGHAMAYDSVRGRVVMFRGLETWEWDGNTWVERMTVTTPSTRSFHALAYDSARSRVVLFGGSSLADTWEYGPIDRCAHAASVVAFEPGSGAGVSSALDALGPPDDDAVSLGLGGSLVVLLDPPAWNRSGADLIVHENALDGGGVPENYRVEVSQDNVEYEFVRDCPGGECQIDLAQTVFPYAQYVRLTDIPPDEGTDTDAGADIDALSAVDCELAFELCNGIDDNDNGILPQDEVDHDGDGYVQCAPWSGSDPGILGGADCGYAEASVYPGAAELCDGLDNDCVGGAPDEANADGDGFLICEGDCDDATASVFPGAPELCDGLANDCDDPTWPAVSPDEADLDGDTYRPCSGECDDMNPAMHPGVAEVCDGIDNDCDLLVDEGVGGQDSDGDGRHDLCDNCPGSPNANQADSDGEIVLNWAWTAVASSEYTSGDSSAVQATGPPESAGLCTDVPTNWAPLGGTSDPEWLELYYVILVKAIGVNIHESLEESFVRQIELRDTAGTYHVVWSGSDDTTCGDVLEARWPMTEYAVDRVVVRTAAPGWEEIDAVQLLSLHDVRDGIGDACDNCPQLAIVNQADFDGDGAGDFCDCAEVDPLIRPAAEVRGLAAESLGAGALRLSWEPAAGAASYEIVRGELSDLAVMHLGNCLADDLAALEWSDADLPPPGGGLTYLVRGRTPCGPGTLGFGAYGVARIDTGSACPD